MIWLAITLAGGLGAIVRSVVDSLVSRRCGAFVLPVGTLVINLSGSFLLGFLTGLWAVKGGDPGLRMSLGAGFLGGYTTFSTASVQTARLLMDRRRRAALGYASMMIGASLVLAWLGIALGSLC